MTQHFTKDDFRNMTQIRIEGNNFGDRLTNSINFLTDFLQFGVKQGVDSIQEVVNFVSPSDRQSSRQGTINLNRRVPFEQEPNTGGGPSQDPVFVAENPED